MRTPVRRVLWLLVCLLVWLLAGACTPKAEVIQVGIGDRLFTVEVARTDQDKQRGLMNRDSLPLDHGMLFVYSADRRMEFWMKNTRIPLSIAFLSAAGRITEVRDMRPHSLDSVVSRLPCRYALEVNQGAFEAAGVGEGDFVRLPEGFR